MTVTRKQLRQALLDRDFMGGLYGTATAGAAFRVTDTTNLQVVGYSQSRFGNYWLYRPAAANASDYYRRITADGFDGDDGTLLHKGPAWTVNPLASSDTGYYEVWRHDPRKVNKAFSRALTERCFSIQQDDITLNGQTRYALADAPFSLTSIESAQNQILELGKVLGTDPNAIVEPLQRYKTWWPEPDNDTLYIRFDPRLSGTLRVTWKKPYANITDDTTTTTCDLEWLTWATAFELYTTLSMEAQDRGETSANYDSLKDRCYNRYWGLRQMFMDRWASQIIRPPARWRSSSPAPRMGRGWSNRLGGAGGMTVSG